MQEYALNFVRVGDVLDCAFSLVDATDVITTNATNPIANAARAAHWSMKRNERLHDISKLATRVWLANVIPSNNLTKDQRIIKWILISIWIACGLACVASSGACYAIGCARDPVPLCTNCSHCQKQLETAWAFCPACGTVVRTDESSKIAARSPARECGGVNDLQQ